MSLTPEEKTRIYEEETLRKEAQDSLKAADAVQGVKGCLVLFAALAVVLFLFFMFVFSDG